MRGVDNRTLSATSKAKCYSIMIVITISANTMFTVEWLTQSLIHNIIYIYIRLCIFLLCNMVQGLTVQRQRPSTQSEEYVQLTKHGCDKLLREAPWPVVSTPSPSIETISSWTDRTLTESVSGLKRAAVVPVMVNFNHTGRGYPFNTSFRTKFFFFGVCS